MADLSVNSGGTLLELCKYSDYICTISTEGVSIFNLVTGAYIGHADLSGVTTGTINSNGIYLGTSAAGVYHLPTTSYTGDVTANLVSYLVNPAILGDAITAMDSTKDSLLVLSSVGLDFLPLSSDTSTIYSMTLSGLIHCHISGGKMIFSTTTNAYVSELPKHDWYLDLCWSPGEYLTPGVDVLEKLVTTDYLGNRSNNWPISPNPSGTRILIGGYDQDIGGHASCMLRPCEKGLVVENKFLVNWRSSSYYDKFIWKSDTEFIHSRNGGSATLNKVVETEAGINLVISTLNTTRDIRPWHYDVVNDIAMWAASSIMYYVDISFTNTYEAGVEESVPAVYYWDRLFMGQDYTINFDYQNSRIELFKRTGTTAATTSHTKVDTITSWSAGFYRDPIAIVGTRAYARISNGADQGKVEIWELGADTLDYIGLTPTITYTGSSYGEPGVIHNSGLEGKLTVVTGGGGPIYIYDIGYSDVTLEVTLTPTTIGEPFQGIAKVGANLYIAVYEGPPIDVWWNGPELTEQTFGSILDVKLGEACFVAVSGIGVYVFDTDDRKPTLLNIPDGANILSIWPVSTATRTSGLMAYGTTTEHGVVDLGDLP